MTNTISPEAIAQAKLILNIDEPSNGRAPETNHNRLDVGAYLQHYDIPYREKNNGTGTIFLLDHCLFDQSHTKNESSIIQTGDGRLLYQCFHDGCKGREWKEARKIISGDDSLKPFCSLPAHKDNTEKLKSTDKKIFKAVTISDLLNTEFKPRKAILHPWLNTQGLALIHAPRGIGKTLLNIDLAVAVTSGGACFRWNAPTPFGALYIDGEMPGVALQERFARAIRSSSKEPIAPLKIITPDLQEDGMPDLATREGQEALEPHLNGVSLIIVDNLSTLVRSGRESDGDDWVPVQEWALNLRSRGYSIIFIHHDGKGGQQRGTSRKEDVLDTIIHLKRPGDYRPEEGARFEVHFEKSRMLYGDDVKAFEAMLSTNTNGTQEWTLKDLEQSLTERVANLIKDGVPQNEIAELLQVAKGTVSKHKNKAQSLGLLR